MKFIGLENVDEMFTIFAATVFRHTNDPRTKSGSRIDNRRFGHFIFLLRCIMIRHTQKQTYRGTTTTLMSLPPKVHDFYNKKDGIYCCNVQSTLTLLSSFIVSQVERTVKVEFGDAEKEDYAALDKSARRVYTEFKRKKGHELSKHYLRLTQKLTPLRIAASGGRVPLDDEVGENAEETDCDDVAEEAATPKKKAKKEKRYSDFAYKSKVDALVAELNRARDEDPHGESLYCVPTK